MRYVVTADEMRRLDALTIDDIGLPGAVLMENAGRAVVQVALDALEDVAAGGPGCRVAVVCGAGNNGGDGHVIARCLRQDGIDATVYLAASEEKLSGDARLHFDVYRKLGGPVISIAGADALDEHAAGISSADLVIDAVFGTGLTREVTGHYRRVIETINRSRGVIVAVDIPSGLSADTGQTLGVAVQADHTVTMAFLKIGLASAPGFALAGKVHVAEIGIPESLGEDQGIAIHVLDRGDLAGLVPSMSALDHKNRRGHVLAVAGSPGKRGAARLLAWGALRSGAGLVTLAAPWPEAGEIRAPDPIMTARLDPDDGPESASIERLAELAEGKRALAMGPGMPASPGGKALVRSALADLGVPAVLDADALNHLAGDLGAVARAGAPVIMTPHPGEAARLLGVSAGEIERDRVAAARKLARESRAVVVLKGARTLICDGRNPGAGESGEDAPLITAINPSGGPALATAGSGDVLTGIIAALVAQGLDAFDAARLGVYLHGRAGDLAADELGAMSVSSADISGKIPAALGELE